MFSYKIHWNSQKVEKQRKVRTKVCNLIKSSKSRVSCRKFWYMMTSVKISRLTQKFFLLYWKSCIVYVPSFKPINRRSLSISKYGGNNFTTLHSPFPSDDEFKIRWLEYSWLNLLSHLIHWITSYFLTSYSSNCFTCIFIVFICAEQLFLF